MSLISVMVAASIFGLLLTLGMRSFHQSTQVWRKLNSTTEASVSLRRATAHIQRDLFATSSMQIRKFQGPTTLAGFDGDAFWFLSALDAQGNFVRTSGGKPFWQKNILYYTVTPNISEVALFGAGGTDPAGYEDHCPYKLLIRKEIDFGTATDLSDEATVEALMTATEVGGYLTRPDGLTLQGIRSEAGVLDLQLVARGLLSTRCTLGSGEVKVRLLASANERAEKQAGFGGSSLSGQPFIHEVEFTIVPRIDGG